MLTEQTDPDRRRRRQTKLELSEFVAAAARDAVSKVTFNSRSIFSRTPRNTSHQQVAKPLTNQQDTEPTLTC
jgi:hypothetical protein